MSCQTKDLRLDKYVTRLELLIVTKQMGFGIERHLDLKRSGRSYVLSMTLRTGYSKFKITPYRQTVAASRDAEKVGLITKLKPMTNPFFLAPEYEPLIPVVQRSSVHVDCGTPMKLHTIWITDRQNRRMRSEVHSK